MDWNVFLDGFKQAVKGPEFWMSFAFFAVILIAFRPIKKRIQAWGGAYAAQIQAQLDQPANLRKNAEELLAKYEERTKNRDIEYADMMKQAEAEIDFLQQDFDQKLKERLHRKDVETQLRLQMIHENGVKEMENKMLKLIVDRTYEMLAKHTAHKNSAKEVDVALDCIYSSLKENAHLIRK